MLGLVLTASSSWRVGLDVACLRRRAGRFRSMSRGFKQREVKALASPNTGVPGCERDGKRLRSDHED